MPFESFFFLNKMVYTRKMKRIIFALLIFFSILSGSCSAWEWSDFLGGGGEITFQTKTLSMDEVRQMRVRDIKRRLARSHGYSADELYVSTKVILKKEKTVVQSYYCLTEIIIY